MLNSYVVIVFALINLIISNLTSLSWRCYVHSLAPLTINILTYLNNVLFQTYNLLISLLCLAMLVKYSWGTIGSLSAVIYPLAILTLLMVEGILVAIAGVRLLFVLKYQWISSQAYEQLGRRILLIVFACAAGLTAVASVVIFQPGTSGKLIAEPNKQRVNILVTAIFLGANLCVLLSYISCRHRRRIRQKGRQRSSMHGWGTELMQFHALLEIYHQDDLKKRMNRTTDTLQNICSFKNFSSNHPCCYVND